MLKIIGAGLPRTGTLTLHRALSQLGFGPCYHTKEITEKLDHIERWIQAYAGQPLDPRALFAGYRATTDAPGCFFWRELVRAYPDARVILSTRDVHAWYASMRNTVLRQELLDHADDPVLAELHRLARATLDHAFGDRRDEAHLTEVFHRHNSEVCEGISADRLLVYDVREGWEPLCAFLGVNPPDTPFPWLNDTAQYVAKAQARRRSLREA
ncbi:hypothetical protein OK074_2025 [Actinobacteria bacterium OK074]|nr:hypothetical protein OK074_2025 [Actinobacteria bacterium OK074]